MVNNTANAAEYIFGLYHEAINNFYKTTLSSATAVTYPFIQQTLYAYQTFAKSKSAAAKRLRREFYLCTKSAKLEASVFMSFPLVLISMS